MSIPASPAGKFRQAGSHVWGAIPIRSTRRLGCGRRASRTAARRPWIVGMIARRQLDHATGLFGRAGGLRPFPADIQAIRQQFGHDHQPADDAPADLGIQPPLGLQQTVNTERSSWPLAVGSS